MKKEAGLSGIRSRVLGRSTTPSTTISATWMPVGQSAQAIDSARLGCAPFAEEKEADLVPPLRDAVAPTKTMLPRPARIGRPACYARRRHGPPRARDVLDASSDTPPADGAGDGNQGRGRAGGRADHAVATGRGDGDAG